MRFADLPGSVADVADETSVVGAAVTTSSRRRLAYICESASDGHSLGIVRPLQLARISAGDKWRPVVVASTWADAARTTTVVRRGGVALVCFKAPFAHNVGVRRAANMLVFALRSALLVRRLRLQPGRDLVLTSSTGGFDCVAGLMARARGTSWVAEIRDVWPDAPRQLRPGLRTYGLLGLSGLAHRLTYRFATAFLSPLAHLVDRIDQSSGLRGRRVLHLPNCASAPPTASTTSVRSLPIVSPEGRAVLHSLASLRRQSPVVIGYFGSMNAANGVGRLVDLVARLDPAEASAVFVGRGDLPDAASGPGGQPPNLRCHPAVPPDECRELMRRVDVLIFGISPLPVYRYGLSPIKLAEYLAAGKPVFYWGAPLGLGGAAFRDAAAGAAIVSIESPSVEGALAALRSLVQEDPGVRARRGATAAGVAASTFTYSTYAASFTDFLTAVGKAGRGRRP